MDHLDPVANIYNKYISYNVYSYNDGSFSLIEKTTAADIFYPESLSA